MRNTFTCPLFIIVLCGQVSPTTSPQSIHFPRRQFGKSGIRYSTVVVFVRIRSSLAFLSTDRRFRSGTVKTGCCVFVGLSGFGNNRKFDGDIRNRRRVSLQQGGEEHQSGNRNVVRRPQAQGQEDEGAQEDQTAHGTRLVEPKMVTY